MTSRNNPSHIPTPAMIEAGRRAMISDEWSSMVDLNRLPQAYLAMEAAREPTPTEDVVDEARFLCARLREWEGVCDGDECCREYSGHVSPSLARLEMLLASLKETTKDRETDREALLREAYSRAFREGAESTIEQWRCDPTEEPDMPHKDCENEGSYQFVQDFMPRLAEGMRNG